MQPGQSGLVSVVTPCHNALPFVIEALDSVQAQIDVPVEHIVVDDASTDDTWAVVRAYADRHAGVLALRLEQNGGGAHARNVGAAVARGEFLMFLDHDDVLAAPDTLAALVEAVRARPGSLGVAPWSRLRQRRDRTWAPVAAEVPLPLPGADHVREWLDGVCWVPPCAVLWPREVYAQTGGWDESLSLDDDADLMMRVLLGGASLVTASRGLAYYRDLGAAHVSVSNNLFTESRIQSRIRVVDKLSALLEARGRLGEYAVSLGVAYQRAAMAAYQQGLVTVGRACQLRGEALAGRQPVSRTLVGSALARILGLERKERMAQAMATWGIGPRWRRVLVQRSARIGTLATRDRRVER